MTTAKILDTEAWHRQHAVELEVAAANLPPLPSHRHWKKAQKDALRGMDKPSAADVTSEPGIAF